MTVIVYTDGACKSGFHPTARQMVKASKGGGSRPLQESTGMGGWAWWVSDDFWGSGAVDHTTNNRMEMLAVIEALKTCSAQVPYERLLIVSDSAYVVNCFADGWYEKWFRNGWKNSAGKPVKNLEMWQELLEAFYDHPSAVSFRHVRGHGRGGPGDAPYVAGNDKADRLCVAARKTLEHPERKPSDKWGLPKGMA